MSDFITRLARPDILALEPYIARGGYDGSVLALNANENPDAPPGASGPWNRYPAQQEPILRARLAALYGVGEAQLLMTRGADEGIDLLLRAICAAGEDAIIVTPPTFGLYACAAAVQGAKTIAVPLDEDFAIDVQGVIAAAQSPKAKLIFLCRPNNPTGGLISRAAVLDILENCPDQLVVVDEAYIEFSDDPGLVDDLESFENLAILRTLSKAYGLAGARLGTVLASAELIALLRKVLPPYPLPAPVLKEVNAALAPVNMPVFERRIASIIGERQRVFTALATSSFVDTIWPSCTNFLLLRLKDKDTIMRRLQKNAVAVRDFSSLGPDFVRLSIGNKTQNDSVLASFDVDGAARQNPRTATVRRTTAETDICAAVDLDCAAPVSIDTGIGFYDHMLEQIARHGGFSLILSAKGDLHIDDHHTVEDCAIALGQALCEALGTRAGIGRYGFILPMDEAQARIAIDLSGRPNLRFDVDLPPGKVGDMACEMVPHVFESLAQHLGAAIHIEAEGHNTHHVIEAIFKGVGRALRPAVQRTGTAIPSSKGVL